MCIRTIYKLFKNLKMANAKQADLNKLLKEVTDLAKESRDSQSSLSGKVERVKEDLEKILNQVRTCFRFFFFFFCLCLF